MRLVGFNVVITTTHWGKKGECRISLSIAPLETIILLPYIAETIKIQSFGIVGFMESYINV